MVRTGPRNETAAHLFDMRARRRGKLLKEAIRSRSHGGLLREPDRSLGEGIEEKGNEHEWTGDSRKRERVIATALEAVALQLRTCNHL